MDTRGKLPELWQSTPKAHRMVIAALATRMTSNWTFEEIYLEVVLSGPNLDDDDILATTRALVIIRDHRRTYQD